LGDMEGGRGLAVAVHGTVGARSDSEGGPLNAWGVEECPSAAVSRAAAAGPVSGAAGACCGARRDADHAFELAAAEDQQPIEAFPAHGADPALRGRSRPRVARARTMSIHGHLLEDVVAVTPSRGSLARLASRN